MPVITVARQYGAGGERIARLVAESIGADVLDRQLVAEISRRLEIPQEEVEEQAEAPGSLLARLLSALGSTTVEFSAPPEAAAWTPPYADPAFDPSKAILTITQEMIREAAKTKNAVIVGHGATYLLQHQPSVLHVFLIAPEETRVKAIMKRAHLSEEEARKKARRTDANRAAYAKQVYGLDWLRPNHYHLVIDTEQFGYEGSRDLVLAALEARRSAR